MGRVLLGEDPFPDHPPSHVPFDPGKAQAVVSRARSLRAQARFAEGLTTGESLEAAALAAIRELLAIKAWYAARSLADGVGNLPGGATARHLGLALTAQARGWYPLAWSELQQVDVEVAADHLAREAVEICLHVGDEAAAGYARALADQDSRMPTAEVVEVAARFLVTGEHHAARRLVAQVDRRGTDPLDARAMRQLDVVREGLTDPQPPSVPADAVRLGVLDYHQPDQGRASRNVGDYVQTLAMLGNLARFSDCTFSGEEGLGDLVTGLQDRVRDELRTPGVSGRVHLMPVNRDFSSHDPVPPSTWILAFGWHLHSLFGLRHDFPYHPNLRPLFASFHVNHTDALTDEAIAYLRRYAPIGCRDWTTVDLLLSAGVDAFFTGCLTTTVGTVFPSREEVGAAAEVVGLVDVPPNAGKRVRGPTESISHGALEYRDAQVVDGVMAADALLDGYQRRYARVLTSRLHCYLPATALGIPVRFLPSNPADIRFEGLVGMTPRGDEFVAMRDGILELLSEILALMVAGESEDVVYDRWREVTTGRVEQAKARLAAATADPVEAMDLTEILTVVDAAGPRHQPREGVDGTTFTDVALSLDQNLKPQLPVTLEALVSNASGPLRLWITSRGLDEQYRTWLSEAFPTVPITFLLCDRVDYGTITRMIRHVTVATMDRLLLPELLPDLGRVTYVDIDALALGDVCELARIDLQGKPLAARSSGHPSARAWQRAGDLLAPEAAHELRRVMAARQPFGVSGFNAGVLVMDLARMRADRFSARYLPWAGRFGLNDQDILIAYAGADRVELEPRWNAFPIKEPVHEPDLVHYLGPTKPWREPVAPAQDLWHRYQARFEARVGAWREPGTH
ncbi:MAG: glycosyltransferase [Nocardioides sp.]